MNCSEFDRMLEMRMDGEMDSVQLGALEEHAATCESCREKLAASEQLREILSHMNNDLSVPLPMQAAWRNAVRKEARAKRMKRLTAAVGAAAAVCLLTLGVGSMLGSKTPDAARNATARVATDGITVNAASGKDASSASGSISETEYIEQKVLVEDVDRAREYLSDLMAEYEVVSEYEADGDVKKVYVRIAGESVGDFVRALEGIGDVSGDEAGIEGTESVGLCIALEAK